MKWDITLFVVVKCKIRVHKENESDIEDCCELRLWIIVEDNNLLFCDQKMITFKMCDFLIQCSMNWLFKSEKMLIKYLEDKITLRLTYKLYREHFQRIRGHNWNISFTKFPCRGLMNQAIVHTSVSIGLLIVFSL